MAQENVDHRYQRKIEGLRLLLTGDRSTVSITEWARLANAQIATVEVFLSYLKKIGAIEWVRTQEFDKVNIWNVDGLYETWPERIRLYGQEKRRSLAERRAKIAAATIAAPPETVVHVEDVLDIVGDFLQRIDSLLRGPADPEAEKAKLALAWMREHVPAILDTL